MKQYLKAGQQCYTIGAYVWWDGKRFQLENLNDDTYYDGELVEFDDNGKPYIERTIVDELCTCGHLKSQHLGLNGHGRCTVCDCPQFTWSSFVYE